jgi:hypothetical protein
MWIFLNDAFLSVVAHKDDSRVLIVRARRWEDLLRTFPSRSDDIVSLSGSDYPYRLFLPRAEVREAIDAKISGIDYPNFKNSVIEPDRQQFYNRIWSLGLSFERNERGWGWGQADGWEFLLDDIGDDKEDLD